VSSGDSEQPDAVYDVILAVSQAYHAYCNSREESTRGHERTSLEELPVCTLPLTVSPFLLHGL
jgi:hypothetical protein